MNNEHQNINLAILLQSLEDDFDNNERLRIFELLKNSNPTDEAVLGAKMILESNNWDYIILKQAFSRVDKRIDKINNPKTKSINKYLKFAAVLLPIGLVLGYLVNNHFKNSSIEECYTKEEGLPNFMGTGKTNWDNLMELYRAKKMKEAYAVSEKILTEKQQNDTAIYFHGVIGYELKNYKIAKADYAKITQNKKSVFYYDATFRLGFALNKLNENKAAQQQFEAVKTDPNNPYNEKAKVVLEQLK